MRCLEEMSMDQVFSYFCVLENPNDVTGYTLRLTRDSENGVRIECVKFDDSFVFDSIDMKGMSADDVVKFIISCINQHSTSLIKLYKSLDLVRHDVYSTMTSIAKTTRRGIGNHCVIGKNLLFVSSDLENVSKANGLNNKEDKGFVWSKYMNPDCGLFFYTGSRVDTGVVFVQHDNKLFAMCDSSSKEYARMITLIRKE